MRRRPGPAARLAIASVVAAVALLAMGAVVSTTWASFSADSSTSDSNLVALTVDPPTLSSATSGPGGAVVLSWSATPSAAQRPDLTFVYSIYRQGGGGSPVLVNATPTSALTYTDTPPSDGTWTYTVVAGVSSFQSVPSNAVNGLSDRVVPLVSIACGGGACSTGWYQAAVIVSIAATDAGSGVKSITYVLDGASTTITGSTTSFTLGDGAHSVSYSATDQAGNRSATVTKTINVDTTPPAVSAVTVCDTSGLVAPTNAGWIGQGTTYRVLATATDATSGVGTVAASVSVTGSGAIATGVSLTPLTVTCGGQQYSYASAPLTAPASLGQGSGNLTATVTATDVAGNSASGSATGGVDDANPSILTFKAATGAPGSGQVNLTLTGADALSGLAGYELDVYLAGTTTRPAQYPNPILLGSASTGQSLTLASGTHYDYHLTAVDNAGNDSTTATQLNKRAP